MSTSSSQSLATPSLDMVKHVSNSLGTGRKQDSERTNALGFYQKLPVEKSPLYSKYVDILSGLNLEKFTAGIPARTHGVPSEVAHLIRERDEPTLSLQVDSEMVRTEVHGAL